MSHPIVRSAIQALPVYNSGQSPDALKRELGLERIIKLDSNENTLGASAAVVAAIAEAAKEANRYPDRDETEVREILAARLGVEPGALMFSGGSEDVLAIVYRMVLNPGDTVVTLTPGFGLHAICAQACDAKVQLLAHKADWSYPVDAMVAALREQPKVLAFASPSNPVGAMMNRDEIESVLAAQAAETLLVFDEAYVEFAGADWATWLLERLAAHDKPWVVLRTFAKAYALAGLRIGYGVAWDTSFATDFHKTRSPFNVNAMALAAAAAALRDDDGMRAAVARLIANREHLSRAVVAAGFTHAPGHGNFLFIDTGANAAEFADALRRQGVLVKPWFESGYEHFIRASVGTEEECDRLVEAMIKARTMVSTPA